MTFLLPGRSTCFICGQPIAAAVDAAQLEYASPDDIGDVAHHGRPWVHRAHWLTWPMRAAWVGSTRRLLSTAPGFDGVRGVFARRAAANALVIDTDAPLSWTLPRRCIASVREAFRCEHATTLDIDGASWTSTPSGDRMRLSVMHRGEATLDVTLDDLQAWADILDRVAAWPDD